MKQPPLPIFLVGFSGSGKSSTARKIAKIFHGRYADLDLLIENQHGTRISEIFSEHGEAAFRAMEQAALHDPNLLKYNVIATGGGCPCHFDNMAYMNSVGITVYLKAPATVLAQRVSYRKSVRPLLAGIPDEQLPATIEQQLALREPFYTQARIVFPAISLNPYQLLHEIEQSLKEK